ncbi:hypothetical protein Lepto7375DRAFT_1153 [Leptolyngbya sp. PCC 7375]|nr:hypothetical protein Lepto7375DRAFT_1153 [Leptolyngbya sp. PCC 7375]
MSKRRKGNREVKKPKAVSDRKKKQKKTHKNYDSPMSELLDSSK